MHATTLEEALSATDAVLNGLARCAAMVANCSMAMVAVVHADQVWFRARHGLDVPAVPLELSFCRHAMASAGLFEVFDAQTHPQFAAHPLVVDGPRLRYYAGVPMAVDGQVVGCLCVADTQPHRLERAQVDLLQQLAHTAAHWLGERRALIQSLGHLGHEMRTPLNAVMGFTQLLSQSADAVLPPREQAWVGHLLRGNQHLLSLVEDMLQFSRLELDPVPLNIQALPLRRMLDRTIGLMQPLAAQAQVVLHCVACPDDAHVAADERSLQQILVNLVSNAIKYNRRHGTVTIRVEPGASEWRIDVKDEGPGMSPQQLARLFRPFSRVGTDRSIPGNGLGLAIARSLAERMQGSLRVHSAPGDGSVFRLHLQRPAR
ncbi:GAF domain-containing sensor histidine kinase [Azohydromonas aeria]|uniref:GAF domain-containing sensor histidine kinase n=1 Tax=Azohydromonas aeria TaxID=2590212 RepID=UPI0012F94B91|nr:GAF domain-containing sensor histidine kinase [Azohydromonas aeria]